MATISFDYDNTLSRKEIQDLVKELKSKGHRILVITNRESAKSNSDLYQVTKSVGIKDHHVWFYEALGKDRFIRPSMRIDFHVDDDFMECEMIESSCGTRCLDSFDPRLREKLLNL